jgi:hypothetical protein
MVLTSGSFELTGIGLLILIVVFRLRARRKAIDTAPSDGHDRAEQREIDWYGDHNSGPASSAPLLAKSANPK